MTKNNKVAGRLAEEYVPPSKGIESISCAVVEIEILAIGSIEAARSERPDHFCIFPMIRHQGADREPGSLAIIEVDCARFGAFIHACLSTVAFERKLGRYHSWKRLRHRIS